LGQHFKVQGDEAVAGRRLVMELEADLGEAFPGCLPEMLPTPRPRRLRWGKKGALPAREGEPGGLKTKASFC
jgi:hypothetical protein